jgi:hypothetical protein
VNECYRLWLLKNSLTRKRAEKLCNRKPYKRRSLFGWTFSISQIPVVLAKQEFFNSHACSQQLTFGLPVTGPRGRKTISEQR